MSPSRLVVASQNPDKVREVEQVLAVVAAGIEIVTGLDWPPIAETEETLEANALLKARHVAAATDTPAIADDTGLEVIALGGAPGVRTARYAGETASYADNVAHLLRELEGVADRRARFRTVVALASPTGPELVAEGELAGTITLAPRGQWGFGYDPVFEVEGRTLAEMSAAEKHAVSHRARAIRALAALLPEWSSGD